MLRKGDYMTEVNYRGMTDFQRGIKRGIVLSVRHFLEGLPIEVVTEKVVTSTVEFIWNDYCKDI